MALAITAGGGCGGVSDEPAPDATLDATIDASVDTIPAFDVWTTPDAGFLDATEPDGCRIVDEGTCSALSDAGHWSIDTGGYKTAQAWCAPDAANAPSCPIDQPMAGTACGSPGLQCGYTFSSSVMSLLTCDAKSSIWTEVAHYCADDCEADRGFELPIDVPCATGAPIPCAPFTAQTTQEDLDFSLRYIAQCCGALVENGVTVHLDRGCPTSVSIHRPAVETSCFAQCLRGMIAGHRFACGADLACASVAWSTISQ